MSVRGGCFDNAVAYQSINPNVLRAIAWYGSKGNPTAVHRNANGSNDIGELQINAVQNSA
ncbi:transglycosylase SLT domain-containing protein [Paraburkholderia sp. 5N]|uniref:Transglycosylase SLT domain-containing protein n=1 Tax=Paraburkholderia elongata TaxID=2675747 RepID=A0A972SPQ3_9BURK|nr:transglycosylase SLT domain-containing protein [Paraburkholderia elongata]